MTDRLEFGRGIRSPDSSLIFRANQAEPDVFGRLVLPGSGRGAGAGNRFGSWGQNEDGSYSGFIEDEGGEPTPHFYLYVAGGEYAVTSAEDMREVIAGMEDSRHKQEEKRLEREAFVKDIPGKVAAWRERVFEEAKKLELQPTSFYMGGSNDK